MLFKLHPTFSLPGVLSYTHSKAPASTTASRCGADKQQHSHVFLSIIPVPPLFFLFLSVKPAPPFRRSRFHRFHSLFWALAPAGGAPLISKDVKGRRISGGPSQLRCLFYVSLFSPAVPGSSSFLVLLSTSRWTLLVVFASKVLARMTSVISKPMVSFSASLTAFRAPTV